MAGDPTNAGRWAEADVYVADVGTTPPADNDTDPSDSWNLVGYLDPDAGVVRSLDADSTPLRVWGGVTVEYVDVFNGESFAFTAVEDNDVVFSLVYEGSATPTATGGLKTRVAKVPTRVAHAWFIQLRNGTKKKGYIIPKGKITDVGDITENEADLGGAEITVGALPNSSNEMHTELISGYDDASSSSSSTS